jgi:uncharacterized protein
LDEVYSPRENVEIWHHLSKVPNFIAPSIRDINYARLFEAGIKHLVFDIDNTLVSFGAPKLDPQTQSFLLELKARPEVCCLRLASNSTRNLDGITEPIGTTAVQPSLLAFKPLPTLYHRILRDVHDDPASVVMIGDKLIQDIWGANYVGITTVLVQPLGRDNWLDRALHVRWHERRLLRRYLPKHVETWF